jgi:GT2 family glycosyltransferase
MFRKEKMPAISIIVPTYKREEALCKMLQTLFLQDTKNFEILLVDQTPVHTKKTLNFLEAHSDRITWIRQKSPNLPMARNNGLSKALGDFVIFVDDDVLLPANCITLLVSHLASRDCDGVTGMVSFEKDARELRLQYEKEYGSFKNLSSNGLVMVDQFIGAVMAFRREVFARVGGFDENLGLLFPSAAGEDYEFCRRVRQERYKLAIATNLVIQHPLGAEGGCATRELDHKVARMRQIQSSFYIEMKFGDQQGNLGLQAWIRMLRGWVINRGVLKQGLRAMVSRLQELWNHYKIVQKFYLQHVN